MTLRAWILRWRQRRLLGKGLRDAADEQLAAGEVTAAQHKQLHRASRNIKALDRTLDQLSVDEDALGAIDWSKVKDWLIENWPTILRMVLSIAMLLLDPEEE